VTESTDRQHDVITIAQGGSVAFIGRLFSLAFSYLLAIVLARGLGERDYGLFVVGFSLVTLIGSFSMLGLNRGTVRFIALYRGIGEQGREIGTFKAALSIVLISGLTSAAVVVISAPHLARLLNIPSELTIYFWGIACWIIIWAFIYELTAVVEALHRLEYRAAIIDVGWPLARLLLTIGALLLGGKLIEVIAANVLGSLLTLLVIGFIVYRIFLRKFQAVPAVLPTRQLLLFSLPVMLFNLLNLSQSQVEIYLLTVLRSSETAGIFNAAARTSMLIVAFLEGLGIIFSPFVSDLANQRQTTELNKLMSTVTRWSFMVGAPVALIIILFGEPILHFFGNGFIVAVPALRILALAQLVNATTGPVGVILTMSGHPNLNLLNSVLTLGLSIFLGFLLIPRLGILGAAISSGISTSLVNLLRTIQVFQILRIWAYNGQFLKPIAAVLIAVIITYVTVILWDFGSEWFSLIAGGCIFVLTYAVMILGLGLNQADHLVINILRNRIIRSFKRI
jgi:O-antigen/teichoic acid export membrane protein